jgi:hypothetical protein
MLGGLMRNPDQLLDPTTQDPIELELLAIHELAAHPIIWEAQLAMMGAGLLIAAVESFTGDE